METFAAAWHALLSEVGEAFVARHLDTSMHLAVSLYCQNDAEAERAASGISSADLQAFVALSQILRQLLEAVTRDQKSFLLPEKRTDTIKQASLLRVEQRLYPKLSEAFKQRLRQLLAMHWDALIEAGETTTFSLPRIQQMHWNLAKDDDSGRRIHLRLQTSDGQTRTIHVPVKQFHELRHSVASVLQEMNKVEAHPIMQLTTEEETHYTPS